jgi:hypothetical protein
MNRLGRIDPSLAAVRDKEALARLSETERKAWSRQWNVVEAVLAKAKSNLK